MDWFPARSVNEIESQWYPVIKPILELIPNICTMNSFSLICLLFELLLTRLFLLSHFLFIFVHPMCISCRKHPFLVTSTNSTTITFPSGRRRTSLDSVSGCLLFQVMFGFLQPLKVRHLFTENYWRDYSLFLRKLPSFTKICECFIFQAPYSHNASNGFQRSFSHFNGN